VDQVEVQVVQAEQLQALVEGAERLVVAVVGVPQLGGDEQLVPGNARDRLADAFLVAVGRGGVDAAVAGLQCRGDRVEGLLLRDLEDAEAELRHLDAVVELDGRNGGHCDCILSA
jgi:hypothetical protein